jgi:hypothetical protein
MFSRIEEPSPENWEKLTNKQAFNQYFCDQNMRELYSGKWVLFVGGHFTGYSDDRSDKNMVVSLYQAEQNEGVSLEEGTFEVFKV